MTQAQNLTAVCGCVAGGATCDWHSANRPYRHRPPVSPEMARELAAEAAAERRIEGRP